MNIRLATLASLLTLGLLVAMTVDAQPKRWIKLGERNVTDRVDHDVINVGADEGRFSKIQLRASVSKVKVRNVVVVFADGSRQERSENFTLRKGEKTPVVDLDGGRRVIREVRFVYEESSLRNRSAKIELWGRR